LPALAATNQPVSSELLLLHLASGLFLFFTGAMAVATFSFTIRAIEDSPFFLPGIMHPLPPKERDHSVHWRIEFKSTTCLANATKHSPRSEQAAAFSLPWRQLLRNIHPDEE